MNTKLFFTIFAYVVVILSIITICTAPIISGILDDHEWWTLNCKPKKDKYDYDKKQNYSTNDLKDQTLDNDKR